MSLDSRSGSACDTNARQSIQDGNGSVPLILGIHDSPLLVPLFPFWRVVFLVSVQSFVRDLFCLESSLL